MRRVSDLINTAVELRMLGPHAERLADTALTAPEPPGEPRVAQATAPVGLEGVEVLHVGCGDLLMAMGKPGAFDDPEIAAAVRTVIECCRAAGKVAGFGGDRDI